MKNYLCHLAIAFFLFTVNAHAQTATCNVVGGHEVTFENEGDGPMYIKVYDQDGREVFPASQGFDNLIDVNEVSNNCDWKAEVGHSSSGSPVLPVELLVFEFTLQDQITKTPGTESYYYAVYGNLYQSDDFYHPFEGSSAQDWHFRFFVGGSERSLLVSINPMMTTDFPRFINRFVGDTWVLPYNLDHICAQQGANCGSNYTGWDVFITPLSELPNPQAPTYTFAAEADVVLPAGYNWN